MKNIIKPLPKNKTALVLAGGGSRGSYHIGVWKALRELGVGFDIVTGTSVGALTGGIIAQGDFETAERVFSSITDEDVIALPEEKRLAEITEFVAHVAKTGGVDVSPLAKLVSGCIDEEKVRASGIKFGLITIRLDGLTPLEITLDEMPKGTLVDYMLASAAFFPGFEPKDIGGERFVDGGSFNNLPIGLAEDLGATDIIAVDLEAIGVMRPYSGGLPVRYIRSYWPLGNIVKFDAESAVRNIRLGYLDTMKAFRRLEGYAYSFECGELQKASVLAPAMKKELAGVPLAGKNAFRVLMNHCDAHRNDRRLTMALLEIAGEVFGAPPTEIYTAESMAKAILEGCDKAKIIDGVLDIKGVNRRNAAKTMARALLDGEENSRIMELLAVGLPREYAAACAVASLIGEEKKA